MEKEPTVEEDPNVLRSEASFFAEWDFVKFFISEICTERWEGMWSTKWEMLSAILLVFQEQPSLLSPYLEDIVTTLTTRLISILEAEGEAAKQSHSATRRFQRMESKQFHAICKVLQLFCRVRGYKYIIKFFPHEVSHVEVCMTALQAQDRTDHRNWETRYILLLWMCQLCLIPFDICSLDSTLSTLTTTDDALRTEHQEQPSQPQSRLVCDIIALSREHLSEAGPTREAAYACLSALFTRPDMEATLLGDFMRWCCQRLHSWNDKGEAAENELNRDSFQLIGILHTMSNIFKKGHRNNVLPYANMALGPCLLLAEQSNQTLVRKLLIKVTQRIGLIFLPPREAVWRYQRGSRSLLSNLNQSTVPTASGSDGGEPRQEEDDDEDEENEVEVPPELEDIVEKVLCALQDKDTVVRWSAAKGIGRITMRLPLDFGDDIVGAVIEIFADDDNESAWHGGCLALAELSRRGLLLPARLAEVVPLVVRAMHFDRLRGQHSVGAHVRDAASYVCWAFARAYAPEVLRPFVDMCAEAMLLASLFDREINCRRAASAAFQENVGRQGNENFPHGIEVIAVADYFSLGNRNNAYLTIAPAVARLSPRFNHYIVAHLHQCKLAHWDSEIRNLAARALGNLTLVNPQCCMDALEPILAACVAASSTSAARHGGVLAVGEIIVTLSMNNKMGNVEGESDDGKGDDSGDQHSPVVTIPQKVVTDTFEVVGKLDKGRMYRGRGGEQLREASCMLVENIARSRLSMPLKVQVAMIENLNENLKQPHEHVQRAAVKALRQMLFSYFPVNAEIGPSERLQALTVRRYMTAVRSDMNIAVVRGCTLALGALPAKLLIKPAGQLRDVLQCLASAMNPDHRIAGEPDAETRRNAVESIAELGERLVSAEVLSSDTSDSEIEGNCFSTPNTTPSATELVEGKITADASSSVSVRHVLRLLELACADYSIDKRGDTGSWARVSGMRGLESVVLAVLRSPHYSPQLVRQPGALFSDMLVTQTGGIQTGSHVLTALGHAVVVACDRRVANTISVSFPPESLGSRVATAGMSPQDHSFSVKLSKEVTLLGQSMRLPDRDEDKDEDEDDTIGDHPHRQAVIDCVRSVAQENSLESVTSTEDVPTEELPPACLSLVIGEDELRRVVGILLKQLGEKLDSVREVAGSVLERLLECTDPHVNVIPDKKVIQDGLSRLKGGILSKRADSMSKSKDIAGKSVANGMEDCGEVANWTRSSLLYTFLVEQLECANYFHDVISGLIISIGGLSEDVAKDSLGALMKWCLHNKAKKNLRDLGLLSNAVVNIFHEHQRNSRVTVPLMKCVCALLRNGVFDFLHCDANNSVSGPFADTTASFGMNLLRVVAKELNRCGELVKIRCGVDLYCLLLLFEDPLRPAAFRALLMLLGHKYPKVRKYTAEQLYVQFISDPQSVGPSAAEVAPLLETLAASRQEVDPRSVQQQVSVAATRSGFATSQKVLDESCDLLTCTVWNDTLEGARAKRAELCQLLGVQLNLRTKEKGGGDEDASRIQQREKKVDELDSYDSLVREAGY